MAKNRIKNIDEIVTQAGTVVDLDNIQATGGGGSTATVNAGNLAISKTETSSEIGYYFNEGGNTHAADGHSSSADSVMMAGGTDGSSTLSSLEIASFSSAGSTTHTSLSEAVSASLFASDGSEAMRAGGHTGSNTVATCEKILFSSSATLSLMAPCIPPTRIGNASSDGARMLMAGDEGFSTSSQIKLFSDSSDSISHSSLTAGRAYTAAGSDGVYHMTLGGYSSGAGVYNTVNVLSFTDNNFSTGHGTLTGPTRIFSRFLWSRCNDNWWSPTNYFSRSFRNLFSDSSVSESFGTLTQQKYGTANGSNGSELLSMCGYTSSGSKTNNIDKKTFTNAVAVTHGTATTARWATRGCSGTA